MMMTAIACFIKLYLVACHFFVNVESITNIVGFVGIGYDLLKGNPEGDFNTGGIDPGFKLARNIFKRTYTQGKSGLFNGESVNIPDQMEYQPLSSCSSRELVSVYDGTKSYQKKLDVNVEVEASASFLLSSFRFSLSAGYSQVQNSVQKLKTVVMDKTAVCSKGRIRYLTATALNTDNRVSDDFYYAVKNLPVSYEEAKYLQFIKDWGTHFIESATLGGRSTNRYESTYSELFKFASENVKTSVSAGGSYKGYSGSFKVDIETFNQQVSQSSTFGSKKAAILSGSKVVNTGNHWEVPASDRTTPIPIKVTLKIITDAFESGLWSNLPEERATYYSLQIDRKLENIKSVLERYPVLTNAHDSSDPAIIFPNAWPDGRYSLPKADTGCPSGGDAFIWKEGYIFQDNEDDNNNNYCPDPFRFSGFCTHDLELYYCSKTVTSNDYGIEWPKGSYCIAKKGEDCPTGFSEGYVRFDDEDDNNRSGQGGVIPYGVYNDGNTRIYYCCRKDDHPHHKITLPTREGNFILIRNHQDGCQEVEGMTAELMILKTDDEDDNNGNSLYGSYPWGAGGRDHHIGYCYYS